MRRMLTALRAHDHDELADRLRWPPLMSESKVAAFNHLLDALFGLGMSDLDVGAMAGMVLVALGQHE